MPGGMSANEGGVCLGGHVARGMYLPTEEVYTYRRLRKHYFSATTVADGNEYWQTLL